jgi:hypothetical protein
MGGLKSDVAGYGDAIGNAYNKALQGVYGLTAEGTPLVGLGM